MAGLKRRTTLQEGSEVRAKYARVADGQHDNLNIQASGGTFHSHGTHRPQVRQNWSLHNVGPSTNFRGVENFPRSTDVDLRGNQDISIADGRQKRRIKKILDHGWCRVCLLPFQVAFINLPCGHMTHCENCEHFVRKCCKCQADIDNTVYCPVYNGRFSFYEWFGFISSN